MGFKLAAAAAGFLYLYFVPGINTPVGFSGVACWRFSQHPGFNAGDSCAAKQGSAITRVPFPLCDQRHVRLPLLSHWLHGGPYFSPWPGN